MQMGSRVLKTVAPAIRQVASRTSTIVGFGTAHETDIIYIDACNGDPARVSRQIAAGQRLPIPVSAIGRAYLYGLAPSQRARHMALLRSNGLLNTPTLRRDIARSFHEIRLRGYCLVLWNDGQHAAVAAPVAILGDSVHAFTIGYVPSRAKVHDVPEVLVDALRWLVDIAQAGDGTMPICSMASPSIPLPPHNP